MLERGRTRERESSRGRRGTRESDDRAKADAGEEGAPDMEMEDSSARGKSKGAIKRAKKDRSDSFKREHSLERSNSRIREPSQVGLKDEEAAKFAKKVEKLGQMKWFGGSGEGDHKQSVHLVKWMNTGKKRSGTHYCR